MKYFAFFWVVLMTFSCGSEHGHGFSDQDIEKELLKYKERPVILEKGKITLTEIHDIPPFDDVQLELMHKNTKFGQGSNKLEFNVGKFVLGDRTVSESETGLLRENGGQHLIVVGKESKKQFSQHVEQVFAKGNNHLLAFLNRSYGISIKSPNAYTFHTINTDSYGGKIAADDKNPFLYLSKPEKEKKYTVSDIVFLDFYLVNLEIGEKGNYLVLKIDDTKFKLTKWSAYKIEGLGLGKHDLSLKVYNKEGKELSGTLLNTGKTSFEVLEGLVFE